MTCVTTYINHNYLVSDFNCLTKMKAAFTLLLALFCYFQSPCEVSSLTLETELNNELASIIKDDLAQGPIINSNKKIIFRLNLIVLFPKTHKTFFIEEQIEEK